MNFISQNQLVENSLNNWDFERAKILKKQQACMNFQYVPNYCKYLADIGDLDGVYDCLKELDFWEKYSIDDESFKVCVYLQGLDSKMLNSNTFFANLYKNTKCKNSREVTKILKSGWNQYVNKDTTPEENMILNYALNLLFDKFIIDDFFLIKIVEHLTISRNINPQRKKFILNKSVKYALENESISLSFFRLRDQFYNQIQKVLFLIHQFSSNEIGAHSLLTVFYNTIKKYNDLSLLKCQFNDKPKVALCISGLCKSDLTGLRSIFDKIVKPLNADVFMHTWDIQQDWAGDSRSYNFWSRVFEVKDLPSNLKDLEFLKSNYPNIYFALLSSHYSLLDKESIFKEFSFKDFLCENQDEFLEKYNIGESYSTRGTFNQVKMFYGLYKSFDMMRSYELNNNIKYDYVIRIRPDLFVVNEVSFEDLNFLDFSEIAVATTGDVGVADSVFYAKRETYEHIINIWESMIELGRLSPFEHYPKYDCHALLFSWLVYKDIFPVKSHISSSLTQGVKELKVPGLQQALSKDCNIKTRFKYPEETEWLETFLKNKAK